MMHNSVDKATTMWEAWFFSSDTFSHNHPMFGSSEVWLLQSVAGIQPHPAAKGFDNVLIKPAPPSQLTHAQASCVLLYFVLLGIRRCMFEGGVGSPFPVWVAVTEPDCSKKNFLHLPYGLHHVAIGTTRCVAGSKSSGSRRVALRTWMVARVEVLH